MVKAILKAMDPMNSCKQLNFEENFLDQTAFVTITYNKMKKKKLCFRKKKNAIITSKKDGLFSLTRGQVDECAFFFIRELLH